MAATEQRWKNAIIGYGEEPPDQLLAFPGNPKRHPPQQQGALDAAISELGWLAPVICNRVTGHVLDGHARIALAISRGETTVPVAYVEVPAAAEPLAVATFDPIGGLAVTDRDALDALLKDVSTQDDALRGFLEECAKNNGVEFGAPPVDVPEPQGDRAADLQAKWQTAQGQLWEIPSVSAAGKVHRLLCGDSTNSQQVARVLGGEAPHLCVTDPPYGVSYAPAWRNKAAAEGHLAYAARRVGKVAHDDRADWSAAWMLFPGDVIYSWHPAGPPSLVHAAALQDSAFVLRMQIIWAKSNFPIGRGDYHVQHEPCWYAVRSGRPSQRTDDRTQTTLWKINLDQNVDGGHSTQKPLECMARPIRNHEGDVYDPFLGSGTTMCAAEQLGRVCYALEIDPGYVAVALERLAGMGLEPRLATATP